MKTLIILAAMLTSGVAMAGEFTVFGKIHFQKASTWVSANKVCQEDGYLYHKTKDYIEIECSGRDKVQGCYNSVRPLVQPMKSTRIVCLDSNVESGNCMETAEVAYNQGTVNVEVYSSSTTWDHGQSPLKTYKYTVDACGSAPKVPAN